jgi:hypothetical protein
MAGFAKCRHRPLILLTKKRHQILAGQTSKQLGEIAAH